jgi:flagellar biosynthesis/type III secretory pathway M-ring protein FliF/YscJ
VEAMNEFWPAIYAVTPTILLGVVFWFIMRALIRADKSERKALAKVEAEERARLGLPMEKPVAE